MRTSARVGSPEVSVMVDAVRPIRMHICGTTYRMEPHEAIALSNALVDAVEDLRTATNAVVEPNRESKR